MNKPRIYIASSWRNEDQPDVVDILRGKGFEVYDFKNPPGKTGFAWSEIDPNWKYWSPKQFVAALDHPLAGLGFGADMGALASCDGCVLVLPCGRSAHLELGYAVGAGKFTAILQLGENEPELMYKMVNFVTGNLEHLVEELYARFGLLPHYKA